MIGVTREQTKKFMQNIIDTNGNPSSKVARECNLEGFFNELCMRNVSKEHMINVATEYIRRQGHIS